MLRIKPESAPPDPPRECCGTVKDERHRDDCRHAWRDGPKPTEAREGENDRRWWHRKLPAGAAVSMNHGQDYMVAKDGSLRRVVGMVEHDGQGNSVPKVVKVRKATKAEAKKLKKLRQAMRRRNAGTNPGGSDESDAVDRGDAGDSGAGESGS